MGSAEVEAFLTHLAVDAHVSASTQNQALQALLFLFANLLYGSGLRLMEALRLRVKDIVIERGEVIVREAKGGKDRITVLPTSIVDAACGATCRTEGGHSSAGELPYVPALLCDSPARGRL